MDGMDAGVMDAPDVETPEVETGGTETEQIETDSDVSTAESTEERGTETDAKDNPFTTQFSRDYRKWINETKAANPEAAKYLQQAKNDYGRLFALQQLEPKGIDGIREKYALLDSLTHGEAKGSEALAAMQESLREAEEVDSYILQGDPRAFESMGEEFNEGLAKLAPAYLERLAQSSPEAFNAAVMPHLVGTLAKSPAIQDFNAMVDVLNEAPPNWLTEQQKSQWAADRLQRVIQHAGKMGEWFNSLGDKAKVNPAAPDPQKQKFDEERTKFEQERIEHHWNTNIRPAAIQAENAKFEELFKPYQQRLKLNDAARNDLLQSFKAGMSKAANQDQEYMRQLKMFRGQKTPDAAAVTNYVKNAINKHSKGVMESIVQARYGSFLAGKPKTAPTQQKPVAGKGPVGPNVEIRTVKPPFDEIDHKRTPIPWLHQGKYYLKSGKIVQVQVS